MVLPAVSYKEVINYSEYDIFNNIKIKEFSYFDKQNNKIASKTLNYKYDIKDRIIKEIEILNLGTENDQSIITTITWNKEFDARDNVVKKTVFKEGGGLVGVINDYVLNYDLATGKKISENIAYYVYEKDKTFEEVKNNETGTIIFENVLLKEKTETIIDAYPKTGIPKRIFLITIKIPIMKLTSAIKEPIYVAILNGK